MKPCIEKEGVLNYFQLLEKGCHFLKLNSEELLLRNKIPRELSGLYRCASKFNYSFILQSVSWSLAEFRHNKIVQSPHENYFNVCRQHKEK